MNTGTNSKLTEDEVPELTEEWFARAKPAAEVLPESVMKAAHRKLGRPRVANPKEQVTLRLSPEVLAHFRSSGKGWQTRIDETVKQAVRYSE